MSVDDRGKKRKAGGLRRLGKEIAETVTPRLRQSSEGATLRHMLAGGLDVFAS